MSTGHVHVGTSGFAYPEWKGDFYPDGLPAARYLEHYATRLDAVEMNHTFHRFPAPELVSKWLQVTPAGFRFSPKVQRSITHSAAGFPKPEAAASFARVVAPLGERLGPLLLDIPAAFKPDPGRLAEILDALALPAAAQFRDPAWFTPALWTVLETRGCVAVAVEEEGLALVERDTAGFAYYRLRSGVEGWASRLAAWAAAPGGREVFAYVRHSPKAPAQALALREQLARG